MSRPPFLTNTRGEPERVGANVGIALSGDDWSGVLAWDEFRQCVIVRRPPPFLPKDAKVPRASDEWTDVDTTRTVHMLASHRVFVTPTMVDDAVLNAARAKPYNPVAEWMGSLEWDGRHRLQSLFTSYFGAQDTPYHRGIARCWMISAVARTYQPGCQCDYLVVLQGATGVGKTSALRALIGQEWMTETPCDLGNKDAVLGHRGKLCVVFDELNGLTGKGALERAKNYLTRTVDSIRPPYGRRTVDVPRRVIFAATTEEEMPFTDPKGSRRFWPVWCTAVDVEGLKKSRDQLFAEAVALYKRGAKWYPGPDLGALCAEVQSDATQRHPWEGVIKEWLGGRKAHIARNGGVTTSEVLGECLNKPSAGWTHSDGMLVGGILRRLGFVPKQVRGPTGRRERRYVDPMGVSVVTDRDRKAQ